VKARNTDASRMFAQRNRRTRGGAGKWGPEGSTGFSISGIFSSECNGLLRAKVSVSRRTDGDRAGPARLPRPEGKETLQLYNRVKANRFPGLPRESFATLKENT